MPFMPARYMYEYYSSIVSIVLVLDMLSQLYIVSWG
jgi:hypothetical protein